MSNKKQTAVGWLVEKLKAGIDPEDGSISMNWLHDGTIEQAKEMEKQQIIDSLHYFGIENAEEYYTETYGRQTYEQ